jgi:predicted nucleotidyltransferase
MQPDRIYLFGSQASGQADPGSDIDLLLVLPESDLPRHRREALSY